MGMKFQRQDKVRLNFSFKERLAGAISWFMLVGKWRWAPKVGYIRGYREEMVAWEVMTFPDKWAGVESWYVVEARLEHIK